MGKGKNRAALNLALATSIEKNEHSGQVIRDEQPVASVEILDERKLGRGERSRDFLPAASSSLPSAASAGTGTLVMRNGDVVPVGLVSQKSKVALTKPEHPRTPQDKRKAVDITSGFDLEAFVSFMRTKGYLHAEEVGANGVSAEDQASTEADSAAADSDNDSVVAVLNFHVSHSKGAPKSAGPKGGSVPRSVMDAVFARDSNRCCYCHEEVWGKAATVDHVLPLAAGGPGQPENLHTSCEPCNSAKSCYWLLDLVWTAEDPVGFPPASTGTVPRPRPFTVPSGVAATEMASLCHKVRAIVKALADQDPDLFARIKGGFPGNFDAVREYVEETDEGLRDSPLKRRRVEEPAQQGQEGVEESGEGAEKGQATEDGAQGEDGGVAKSTTE